MAEALGDPGSAMHLRSTLPFAALRQPVRLDVTGGVILLAVLVALLLFGWCAATTTYALFHDRALEAIADRHVARQQASRSEILRLRAELERTSSLHLIERTGFAERLAELERRQEALEAREEAIAAPGAPQRDGAANLSPIPGDGTPQSLTARLDAASIKADLLTTLQERKVAEAVAATEREAAALRLAYSRAGVVPISKAPVEAGLGGPFIAMSARDSSASDAGQLMKAQAERDRLRAGLDAIPVRHPAPGSPISSGFGGRSDPFLGEPAFHSGVDFRQPTGAGVSATADGTVITAGWSGGYGQLVEIRHASGFSTRYGHLATLLVQEGQRVRLGEIIGRVGSTGRSTGAHLHYEVRRDGQAVNPARYLSAAAALGN
jgi:murein DD-endopeptidase MepM/ murein hydrolase activator NlpD